MAGPATSIIRQIVLPSRCLLRGWLALIILLLPVESGLIEAAPLSLDNPGFEQGSAQWLLKPGAETAEIAPDRESSHSGQASLRLSGAAADNPYAAQLVGRIEPLATYRLAATVRAAEGSEAVATVRIEFYDGDNRNISVWRQQFLTKSDGTWQTIEQTATAEATAVNAVVVLRLLGPGELWFDDVELTVVSPGPGLWAVPTDLAVTAGQPDTVAFDLHLAEKAGSAPPLQFSVNCPMMVERIIPDFRIDRANNRIFSVLLSLPALPPGLYTVQFRRTDTGAVGQANLVAIPPGRSDGVTLVDGEPFFPICARFGDATEFEALQAAGFNTVELPSTDDLDRLGQLLDRADERHLKAIVPLYDDTDSPIGLADCEKKVERFRDQPALLAWKLMHLPTVHPDWRKPAIEAFLHLKQTSADKPVVVGIGNSVQYPRWVDFLDWLEVVCYPGSSDGPSTVAELTEQARRDTHPGQVVYATLPAIVGDDLSDQVALSSRRMMLYLALIVGAQGIGWQGPSSAIHEREILRQINAEAAQLGRTLVSGEPAQVICSTDRIRFRAVKQDGAILTMVANTTDEHVIARIQLPEIAGMVKCLHAYNTPAAQYMPMRLSDNGRVVTFALPGGQCDTVVATLR